MNKTSFAAFKSNTATLTEKLQSKLKEETSGGRQEDERFWRPTRDKAGNGYAVLRFLPAAPNPDVPTGVEDCFYVRLYSHAFQGKGGWYIENSLTTIGDSDPCGEYNSTLWNAGVEDLKEQARKQKRKTTFISNVLVIEDPANPENNGKVFLYKYGKKIFEKINDKMYPQFPDDPKFNPFDFWAGANFKLKIREVEKFPNYDKSEFDAPLPLYGGDDAKLEAVWRKQYPLLPLLDKSQFKTYDELKRRLNKALGITAMITPRVVREEEGSEDNRDTSEDEKPKETTTHVEVSTPKADDAEEDELAYFKRMANRK